MTQRLFDEVIGAVPPSTLDVRAIVRRQQRARRVRRVLGGSAGTLALAGALVLGNALVGVPTDGVAPQPGTATPARIVPPDAFALKFGTPAEAQATTDRLTLELDRALHAHAPGVGWVFEARYPTEPVRPDGEPPVFRFEDGVDADHRWVGTSSGISGHERRGSLQLDISAEMCDRPGSTRSPLSSFADLVPCDPPMICPVAEGVPCTTGVSPGGLPFTRTEQREPADPHPMTLFRTTVRLDTGLRLTLLVRADWVVDDSTSVPEPPVTPAQNLAIATAIADKIIK